MKEFISKNTLLVITLTISISSFLAYLRLESDAKESAARIDNIISILKIPTQTQFNKDSLVNELKEGNFREDYYTKQLAMQSDWFILYVTALFGILSIIGFAYFSHEINRTKDYINEKIDDEQKKSMIHRMEFKELKIDHYQALGNISTIAALISIEQGLSVQTIKRSMEAVAYLIRAYHETDDDNLRTARLLKVAPGRSFFNQEFSHMGLYRVLDLDTLSDDFALFYWLLVRSLP